MWQFGTKPDDTGKQMQPQATVTGLKGSSIHEIGDSSAAPYRPSCCMVRRCEQESVRHCVVCVSVCVYIDLCCSICSIPHRRFFFTVFGIESTSIALRPQICSSQLGKCWVAGMNLHNGCMNAFLGVNATGSTSLLCFYHVFYWCLSRISLLNLAFILELMALKQHHPNLEVVHIVYFLKFKLIQAAYLDSTC